MTAITMPASIYTAGRDYAGSDALVLAHGANGALWIPFTDLTAQLARARHLGATPAQWEKMHRQYTDAIRLRRRGARREWRQLLRPGSTTTITCICTDPLHCERTWLAQLLAEAGATYHGERTATGGTT